mgnify:CR=1 FL=1
MDFYPNLDKVVYLCGTCGQRLVFMGPDSDQPYCYTKGCRQGEGHPQPVAYRKAHANKVFKPSS